jgi:hypothetical protein
MKCCECVYSWEDGCGFIQCHYNGPPNTAPCELEEEKKDWEEEEQEEEEWYL